MRNCNVSYAASIFAESFHNSNIESDLYQSLAAAT